MKRIYFMKLGEDEYLPYNIVFDFRTWARGRLCLLKLVEYFLQWTIHICLSS